MKSQILNLLKNNQTLPFLFVGSGLSRRYLGLENWEDLLKRFADMLNEGEYTYKIYRQQAESQVQWEGLLPKVAELIENDFNPFWYRDIRFDESRQRNKTLIEQNVSPLKIEISDYVIKKSTDNAKEYKNEIDLFRQLGKKSIAGVITTNYDLFLENTFEKFTTYIGQEELLFSQIQGISEIYKIHGSASQPDSLVINEKDYLNFSENNAYLAAKLMTIFLEHPVIFLGYSISDNNIENILKSIVKCLTQEHLEVLKKRLIFIEWNEDGREEISTYSKSFEGTKSVEMTRIRLKSFEVLYQALLENKAKYNVSMLRQLKEDIYEDILLNNGNFDVERIIYDTLPILFKSNSNKLPFYKYLSNFNDSLPLEVEKNIRINFDDLLNATIIKNRDRNSSRNYTIYQLEQHYSLSKCLQNLAYLKPERIDVDELKELLISVFKQHESSWETFTQGEKSDFKRAIRIYDLLKYGKKKSPSQSLHEV